MLPLHFKETSQPFHLTLLLLSSWPELRSLVIPSCKTGWPILSFKFIYLFILAAAAHRIPAPQPGTEPMPSAVKAQSPSRWTAREPPDIVF